MKIVDLQINHLTTPLGFALDDPRLSWRYDGLDEGDGTRAAQARITVARTKEELLAATGGQTGSEAGTADAADTTDTDSAETGNSADGTGSSGQTDPTDNLLYDTGWQTGLDPRGTALGLGLDWRLRYWWRVQVRTDTGRLVSSRPTWFETGVMEDEWIADWITTGRDDPQDSRHPVFSRRLRLDEDPDRIERARVYACGLGLMRLFVDGHLIGAAQGQGHLDPGDFATDAWLQTMTYDVTDALRGAAVSEAAQAAKTLGTTSDAGQKVGSADLADSVSFARATSDPVLGDITTIPLTGSSDEEDDEDESDQDASSAQKSSAQKSPEEQAAEEKEAREAGRRPVISILLGNGWYRGRVLSEPAPDPRERPWDLIAEIHIWYKDGRHQVLGTNHNWLVTRSHITDSSIYDGESRDDTLPDATPVFAAVNQRNHALLYDRLSTPVTVCAEIPVAKDLTTPSGRRIFDLGQNFAGVFRLTSRLPRGAHLTLLFAEHMEDGELDRRSARTARQRYDYVSDGIEKQIEPLFTYYGYRYAQVQATAADGTDLTGTLDPHDFTGLALSSQMARTGRVTTGNQKVNRLLGNVEWSRRSNFMDTPTDCPQRDERLGWTGDAQVFAPTALYLSDATAFYRKYLFDMRAEQERRHGMVPVIIPARGDSFSHLASAAWSDAAVLIPWDLYRFTGDPTLLAQSYPLMKDWVDWIARTDAAGTRDVNSADPADPAGPKAWRTHFHFGDWLALDGGPGAAGVRGATPAGLIADAYWYLSATLLTRTARLLRNQNDEGAYAVMSQRVRTRILHDFFDGDGQCTAGTQTGYILALALGLGDMSRNVDGLRQLLKENEGRLTTGFVGTGLLVEALCRVDRDDMLLDMLLDGRYPGWMAAVDLGATTVWERWDSLLPDGRLRYDAKDSLGTMNSLNHYWLGSAVEWFFRRGAGFDEGPLLDSGTGSRMGAENRAGSTAGAAEGASQHATDASVTAAGVSGAAAGQGSTAEEAPQAGFRHMRLIPHISRRLGSLEASYRAPGGVWRLSWRIGDGDKIHVEVVVPFDATAELVLPCAGETAPRRLGPGRHVYDYEAEQEIPR